MRKVVGWVMLSYKYIKKSQVLSSRSRERERESQVSKNSFKSDFLEFFTDPPLMEMR